MRLMTAFRLSFAVHAMLTPLIVNAPVPPLSLIAVARLALDRAVVVLAAPSLALLLTV